MVRGRVLLLSMLVAALVALASLSQLGEVQRSGFEWSPGIVTVIVLILAVTGHRLPWGIAFALAAIGTGFEVAWALTDLDEPARLTVAAVGVIICLALWGLKPDDEMPQPAPPDQG